MSSTEFTHSDGDDYVTEQVTTEAQTAEITGHIPYHHLRLSLDDGTLTNDGNDTETVTITVVDGLEVARGADPSAASVLDSDVTATVEIDGAAVSVSLTGGSGTKDVTTTRAAGTSITVEAVGLDGVPAASDSAEIEVVA